MTNISNEFIEICDNWSDAEKCPHWDQYLGNEELDSELGFRLVNIAFEVMLRCWSEQGMDRQSALKRFIELSANAEHSNQVRRMLATENDFLQEFLTYLKSIYAPFHDLDSNAGTHDKFLGQYQVKRKLGEGAFSRVYHVINDAGIDSAIKVPKISNSSLDQLVRQFQDIPAELELLKKLSDSDFVVKPISAYPNQEIEFVTDKSRYLRNKSFRDTLELFIDSQKAPYIEMQLCEGSLADIISSDAKDQDSIKSEFWIASTIYDIVEGLASLAQRKIYHRDIKPQNILLSRGKPLLADFNVSQSLQDSLSTRNIAGTLEYMSPENIQQYAKGAVHYHNTTDEIWSIGVIFYQLLAGEHPYGHLQRQDYANPNTSILPVPLQDRGDIQWTDSGRELASICMECLHVQGAHRIDFPALGKRLRQWKNKFDPDYQTHFVDEERARLADQHLETGFSQFRRGDFLLARNEAEAALRLKPDHNDAFLLKGLIELQQKNFDVAQGLFLKAEKYAPYLAEIQIALYYTEKKLNNFEKAGYHLRQVKEIDGRKLNPCFLHLEKKRIGKETLELKFVIREIISRVEYGSIRLKSYLENVVPWYYFSRVSKGRLGSIFVGGLVCTLIALVLYAVNTFDVYSGKIQEHSFVTDVLMISAPEGQEAIAEVDQVTHRYFLRSGEVIEASATKPDGIAETEIVRQMRIETPLMFLSRFGIIALVTFLGVAYVYLFDSLFEKLYHATRRITLLDRGEMLKSFNARLNPFWGEINYDRRSVFDDPSFISKMPRSRISVEGKFKEEDLVRALDHSYPSEDILKQSISTILQQDYYQQLPKEVQSGTSLEPELGFSTTGPTQPVESYLAPPSVENREIELTIKKDIHRVWRCLKELFVTPTKSSAKMVWLNRQVFMGVGIVIAFTILNILCALPYERDSVFGIASSARFVMYFVQMVLVTWAIGIVLQSFRLLVNLSSLPTRSFPMIPKCLTIGVLLDYFLVMAFLGFMFFFLATVQHVVWSTLHGSTVASLTLFGMTLAGVSFQLAVPMVEIYRNYQRQKTESILTIGERSHSDFDEFVREPSKESREKLIDQHENLRFVTRSQHSNPFTLFQIAVFIGMCILIAAVTVFYFAF